jgi:metal-responsive CopG/Arc/MetJ family transcriptional regulator
MSTQTIQTKGIGYGGDVNGKCICISFPGHELNLIDEADRLAHLECSTRSQFFRRCIRREILRTNEQIGRRYSSI